MILDIRSGSVAYSDLKRRAGNARIRREAMLFQHISILGMNLAKKLQLPLEKVQIVPLGANVVDMPQRSYCSLRLLYVGAVGRGRHIDQTFAGLRMFIQRHPDIDVTYDVIGKSIGDEDTLFLQKIIDEDSLLKSRVFLRGYIHHKDLNSYWQNANVGISYIPINDKFDLQPPTKTFEYIGIGIPVIATATTENKYVVNDINGVLCEDNPESFAQALETVWERRNSFCCSEIQKTIQNNTWAKITDDLYRYWQEVVDN